MEFKSRGTKGAQRDFGRLGDCQLRFENEFGSHLAWRGKGIEVHVCGQEGLRRGLFGYLSCAEAKDWSKWRQTSDEIWEVTFVVQCMLLEKGLEVPGCGGHEPSCLSLRYHDS